MVGAAAGATCAAAGMVIPSTIVNIAASSINFFFNFFPVLSSLLSPVDPTHHLRRRPKISKHPRKVFEQSQNV
jgi:hypothetical protein